MAQQEKSFQPKPNDLSSIPGTHTKVEGVPQFKVLFSNLHVYTLAGMSLPHRQ